MIKFHGSQFFTISRLLMEISLTDVQDPEELAEESWKGFLDSLKDACKEVHLEMSVMAIVELNNEITSGSIRSYTDMQPRMVELHRRINDELSLRSFLQIPADRVNYYKDNPQFGEEVAIAFPSASNDISEAAKCFALGRNTACVLHLMLVLQSGLNVLAQELGVSFERANWDKVITDIETQIKSIELGGTRQGPNWEEDKSFFSEAALQFRHFKDAWRNHAMHARMHYDHPDKALEIFTHVREFMQHIALKLKEEVKS
jgi:hypothetical protein